MKEVRMLKKKHGGHWDLYLLLIPGIFFLVLFKYVPLLGNIIAFQDYRIAAGDNMLSSIFASEWVGLDNFRRVFQSPDAIQAIINSFILALMKIVFLAPIPILLAVLLNEISSTSHKKMFQTVIYFPYLLSWTVVGAIFLQMFQSTGVGTAILANWGIEFKPFLDSGTFRWMLIFSECWKSAGWGTIIYLAAISGIDPQLSEAAIVDGCNRWLRIRNVVLPGMSSVITLVIILNIGVQFAFGSFEQVVVMYNPSVYKSGDIIQTYAFRKAVTSLDYSFSTAISMLNAFVGVTLIYLCNAFSRKYNDRSIW